MSAEHLLKQSQIERKTIKVSGLNVSYLEYGEGPSVVMFPGWPFGSEMYRKTMSYFNKDERKIISINYPGWGDTELIGQKLNYKNLSNFVRDFLDVQQIEKADVVGVSFGGALALNFSFYFPDKVNKLVAYSPPVVFEKYLSRIQKLMLKASKAHFIKRGIYQMMMNGNEIVWSALLGTPPEVDSEFKLNVLSQARKAEFRALDESLGQIINTDLGDVLPRVSRPTLIIGGEGDYMCQDSVLAASLVPGAKLLTVDGDHAYSVNNAKEFADHISEFIK